MLGVIEVEGPGGRTPIRIREAKPEDKDEILEISSQIWEGHDYIPLVLDRWLEEGGLFAAELDGKVVGFAKTTVLSPGELWFEGLRVHPSYRGRGIAKALAEAQLQEALARSPSPRSIRLATAEVNVESIHISEELGFRELARFTYMTGPVGEGRGSPKVVRAEELDRDKLAEFIFSSESYRQSHGLFPRGWVFFSFTEPLLEELIEQGALFCYKDEEKVRGVIALLPAPHRPDRLIIVIIEGDGEALSELMSSAHRYARERGFEEFRAMVPTATARLVQFLKEHGLSCESDFRYVLVYEYPLP